MTHPTKHLETIAQMLPYVQQFDCADAADLEAQRLVIQSAEELLAATPGATTAPRHQASEDSVGLGAESSRPRELLHADMSQEEAARCVQRASPVSSKNVTFEKWAADQAPDFRLEKDQFGQYVSSDTRWLELAWDASAHAERSVHETKARLCECIPLAPRPYKFCQDCGGQIPVHQQQPFTGSAQETSAPLTPTEMGTVARMAAVSAQVQPEKASTEGRPLTAAEAKVIEEFGDELVTIYPCKCGATPGTTIRGQMFCTNCGEYRADKSQVNGKGDV